MDDCLRKLEDRLTYLRNLEQRQEVKSAIEGQEKLSAGAGGGHRRPDAGGGGGPVPPL